MTRVLAIAFTAICALSLAGCGEPREAEEPAEGPPLVLPSVF